MGTRAAPTEADKRRWKRNYDEKLCNKTIQRLREIKLPTLGCSVMPNGIISTVLEYLVDEPKNQFGVYTQSIIHNFFSKELKQAKKAQDLFLLNTTLKEQFKGIKNIKTTNSLNIIFISAELAKSFYQTLNQRGIETTRRGNCVKISDRNIVQFMNVYGKMNPSLLFIKENLKPDQKSYCSIS